jgi:hypothetical protein
MLRIKTKADMTPEAVFAISEAVEAERHKRLRLLVRIAADAGNQYEYAGFLTMREVFGSAVINLHTWEHVFGGSRMYERYLADYVDHYLSAGVIASTVDTATLVAEGATAAAGVSRETTSAVPEPPVVVRLCECSSCNEPTCVGSGDGDGDHVRCDSHSCEECFGDSYSCDDHDCEDCYSDHTTCEDCGWCSECGSHEGEVDNDRVCPECSHCRECDHQCNDC